MDTVSAIHSTHLVRSATVADRTMAFCFSRPAGFRHRAGQSLLLTLINPPETDSMGDVRTFTIASAPHEADLMIATRMRDTAFKRVLKSASPGLAVQIDGPEGEMVLHDDPARPAVFLAGGIGITPFLSMSRDAIRERRAHRLHLFYANRRPEDAAFLAELQQMERENPNFKLVPVMAEPGKSTRSWTGETGLIRRELLEHHVPGLSDAVFYIAGPPAMSLAMQRLLRDMHIADDAVRHEEFYGY